MASENSIFTVILFLITIVSAGRMWSPEKCKSDEDCKKIRCSKGSPKCGGGVCTCPNMPKIKYESIAKRPCESDNECLKYNKTCSVDGSADGGYCACRELDSIYKNSNNTSGCKDVECQFMCVQFPDWPVQYSLTGDCGCDMIFG